MKSDLQRVREQRAECMLEIDLWEAVNKNFQKRPTKCEAKLNRLQIISVLSHMIARVSAELQGYK